MIEDALPKGAKKLVLEWATLHRSEWNEMRTSQPFRQLPPLEYLKVQSVEALDDHMLLVKFDNRQIKQYDVTPLLGKEMFAPLRKPA